MTDIQHKEICRKLMQIEQEIGEIHTDFAGIISSVNLLYQTMETILKLLVRASEYFVKEEQLK